ncbi:hypothetical protein DFH28DRAFT_899527 [Melampsora americana]|nr:hypothetical protein DFH28DRAFT_917206 [Melampsora americana]KAH9812155.1 hypothetical protein DFH28DRAFT_899527 [Melampsora americana]
MEPPGTLNGANLDFMPHPNQSNQTTNLMSKGCPRCHNKRKNASCSNNVCAECCAMINQSIGCNPHTKQRNRKTKDGLSSNEARKAVIQSTTDNVDPALIASKTIPVTRNGQTVDARYAQGPSFRHFREVKIQDQANERVNNTAEQTANQTISIWFWSGKGNEHLQTASIASDCLRIPAPSWPRFKLEQCPLLVQLAADIMGPSWNRTVRVWNDSEQIWALTEVSTMEKYPVDFCKVLVMLPTTNPLQCEDVQRHIDSVTTRSTKERTKLHPYITPTNSNYNIVFIDGSPTPIKINRGEAQNQILYVDNCSPSTSQKDGEDNSDMNQEDEINIYQESQSQDIEIITAFEDRDTTPTPTPNPKPINNLKPNWPEGVTMSEAKKLIDATSAPLKLTSRKSWMSMFEHSHRKYSKSTVNFYLQWLGLIGPKRLNAFVGSNGGCLVTKAREVHFNEEWKKCHHRRNDEEPGEGEEDTTNKKTNKKRKIDTITM